MTSSSLDTLLWTYTVTCDKKLMQIMDIVANLQIPNSAHVNLSEVSDRENCHTILTFNRHSTYANYASLQYLRY